MGRDVQAAARYLVRANLDDLTVIVRHDPDMIRDVAAAAIRPIWSPCAPECAIQDSNYGPCTCGAEDIAKREAREAGPAPIQTRAQAKAEVQGLQGRQESEPEALMTTFGSPETDRDLGRTSNPDEKAMTHTPGPWFLDRDGTLNTNVMAPDDEHSEPWHVAVVVGACGYPDRPETGCAEANAHLIAAAPDLLACAKIGAECFREYERLHRAKGTPEGDAKAERNAAMARVCEAAIAQAEAQK